MITNTKRGMRIKLPARATVFYTLTGALERGMTFIFTPIFTRLLTPDEYGLYPLYVSWMGVLTVVITLELSGSVIYKGLAKYCGRENEFLTSALGMMTLSFVLSGIGVVTFGQGLSSLFGLSPIILFFLVLQIFINGILNLYFAKCRYFYKYLSASVINVITATASPTLSFFIIRLTSFKAEARIIAPLIVSAALALPLAASFLRGSRQLFSAEIWKYLIRIVAPLLPYFIASTVIAQSGKIAVGRYFGDGALAKYSLVFSLGFIFSVITSGICSGLSPWINRKLSAGNFQRVGELSLRLFSLFAPLTLMAVTFVPEGLSFLAPTEYLDAFGAVFPIAVSVLLGFLSTTLYTVILYYDKSHLVTVATVITAALTVFMHMTVTRHYGYIAAALSQCLSSLLLVIFDSIILGGVLKKRPLHIGGYLYTLSLAISIATLLYLLRNSFVSRVLIFLMLIVLSIPRAIVCYKMIRE